MNHALLLIALAHPDPWVAAAACIPVAGFAGYWLLRWRGAGAGRDRGRGGLAEAAGDVTKLFQHVEKEVPVRDSLTDSLGDDGNSRGESSARVPSALLSQR